MRVLGKFLFPLDSKAVSKKAEEGNRTLNPSFTKAVLYRWATSAFDGILSEIWPSVKVFLRLSVRSNTGREFTYQANGVSDSSGRFEFVVPYATEPIHSPCQAVGPYRIKAGKSLAHVKVSEKSVQHGLPVQIVFGIE